MQKELFAPKVREHRGRIVKLMGDGALVEFASTAVAAALEAMPDLSLAYLAKTLPTKEPDGLEPYLDGLRKAGLPE